MANNTDKAMSAPGSSSTPLDPPAPMAQMLTANIAAATKPQNITESSTNATSTKTIDETSKPRMGVDSAAHHLPFRPAPMVRKRRASSDSPDRDVRRRVGEKRDDGGFTTECFTSAAAPGKDAATGEDTTNFSKSSGKTEREDYLVRLAASKTKPALGAATAPGASTSAPTADELPGYTEDTAADKGLRGSKWAKQRTGDAPDEVEMGGTRPTEWTGMSAPRSSTWPLDGGTGAAVRRVIMERIMSALKKRQQGNVDFVLQGRTVEYYRISFDLDATDPLSFRKRLEQCFAKRALVTVRQAKAQRAIHKALEE
ncbi:hypothetical protein LTR85_007784 [Meristemomyces frigidus]|nr:hypothetical protein LTR85_007784 [Meristemomyces frigidus]